MPTLRAKRKHQEPDADVGVTPYRAILHPALFVAMLSLFWRSFSKDGEPSADFSLMPDIMVAPDKVERGSMDTSGRESVRFIKYLENGFAVVVEKEQKNSPDDLETITMWADKSIGGANARTSVRPLQSTSQPANTQNGADAVTVISDSDIAKIRKDADIEVVDYLGGLAGADIIIRIREFWILKIAYYICDEIQVSIVEVIHGIHPKSVNCCLDFLFLVKP